MWWRFCIRWRCQPGMENDVECHWWTAESFSIKHFPCYSVLQTGRTSPRGEIDIRYIQIYIQEENTVSHSHTYIYLYSYGQVTLERSFLEIFHDIYDKVLLILSRLPQSPTHEIMTEEKEVVDATTLTSPVRNTSSISREVSSKERSRIKSSNLHQKALNKDVRDVLSLVQAGSIMERVSSVNAKSRKK